MGRGADKTPLALQVAAEALEGFPDGVWLVELAALTDPNLVPKAVASALYVPEQPGRALIETLADSHGANRCSSSWATKDSIYLIEETFPILCESRAFFGRTTADYVRRVTLHGWRFVGAEVLPVFASERVCATLTKWLNKRGRKWGEGVTKATVLAQRIALRLTRLIDHVVRGDSGLTGMAFNRGN